MSSSCSSSCKCTTVKLPCKCSSKSICIESVSSGFPSLHRPNVKTVDYEKLKPLLQESSSISSRTLFDQLVDIIKRVIDERPHNVIDYFELFSRDVRERKLKTVDTPNEEPQFLQIAKAVLKPLEPQKIFEDVEDIYENMEYLGESQVTSYASSESLIPKIQRNLEPNENVIQLQHFWAFCGLGFHIDEVFQLSWAMQKIQLHQGIEHARFWGRIYGLNGTYYVAEATLTKSETEIRSYMMEKDEMAKMIEFITRRDPGEHYQDINIIPGTSWQNHNYEFHKMQVSTAPIPRCRVQDEFETPAEFVGCGLNRRVYFVTTALSNDWQELPIVTPKQIVASKKIKKFFTGSLEATLSCYPPFPGTEKHYLRAMIARITSGSYIAPKGYFRRMSRNERKQVSNERQELADDFNSEEEPLNNDCLLIQNSDYEPHTLEELTSTKSWKHVRPNILSQGRVLYIDKVQAFKCMKYKALQKLKDTEIIDGKDADAEEKETISVTGNIAQETGPQLFSSCSIDINKYNIPPWICRHSSVYDATNQMILLSSNLWAGAYSFAFDKFSDSIYLGWGFKYVPRCTSLESLPNIEHLVCPDVASEFTDPTVDMEEKWRLYHLKKDVSLIEEMSSISVDYDVDDDKDEGF